MTTIVDHIVRENIKKLKSNIIIFNKTGYI